MKKKPCHERGKSDCHPLKGLACRNPRIKAATFADWYQSRVGVSLEEAKRAGVYDLQILEDAWNYQSNQPTP